MKPHLEYTSDEYEQQADPRGVCPISKGDAAIIEKLTSIIKNEGGDELSQILDKWKHNSDEAIYKMLGNYSEGKPVEAVDEDELTPFWLYIDIKGFALRIAHIYSISKYDEYVKNRMHYNIVINKGPLPAQFAWYIDTVIPCSSEQERVKILNEIKSKLTRFNLCKFV
jgi:hypothetical protein